MVRLDTVALVRANVDACAFSTYPLIVLVVPLRLWCRVRLVGRQNIGWDDIICIIALLLHTAFFSVCMFGLRLWMGKHTLTEVPMANVIDFLGSLFVASILYTWCVCASKAAILAFYWRLFSVRSRLPILCLIAVVVAWFLAIVFAVVFTCVPVAAQWDITITTAKCIPTRMIWIVGSIFNVLTDIGLLIMPLPYVWKLNAPLAQRIALIGMFVSAALYLIRAQRANQFKILGAFVSVVSIVRLRIMLSLDLSSGDATFKSTEVIIWSIVEINCGLICACLPSLRPAIRLLGLDRWFGATTGPSNPARMPYPHSDNELRPYRRQSRKPAGIFPISAAEPATSKGIFDDDEDSHGIIEKERSKAGVTVTNFEPTPSRISEERAGRSHLAIDVQGDWSVTTEPAVARSM